MDSGMQQALPGTVGTGGGWAGVATVLIHSTNTENSVPGFGPITI